MTTQPEVFHPAQLGFHAGDGSMGPVVSSIKMLHLAEHRGGAREFCPVLFIEVAGAELHSCPLAPRLTSCGSQAAVPTFQARKRTRVFARPHRDLGVAIFIAKLVLPIPGRAPTSIRSPAPIPTITSSRSLKPVGMPSAASLSVRSSFRCPYSKKDGVFDMYKAFALFVFRYFKNPLFGGVKQRFDVLRLGIGILGNLAAHLNEAARGFYFAQSVHSRGCLRRSGPPELSALYTVGCLRRCRRRF